MKRFYRFTLRLSHEDEEEVALIKYFQAKRNKNEYLKSLIANDLYRPRDTEQLFRQVLEDFFSDKDFIQMSSPAPGGLDDEDADILSDMTDTDVSTSSENAAEETEAEELSEDVLSFINNL